MLWRVLLWLEICLAGGVFKTDVVRAQGIYRPEDARCLPWIPCERRLDEEILTGKNLERSVDASPPNAPNEAQTFGESGPFKLGETDIDGNFTLVDLAGDPTFRAPFTTPSSSPSDSEQAAEPRLRSAMADNGRKVTTTTTTTTTTSPTERSEDTVSAPSIPSTDAIGELETRSHGPLMKTFTTDGLTVTRRPRRGVRSKLLTIPTVSTPTGTARTYGKRYFDPMTGETEICECRRIRLPYERQAVSVDGEIPEDGMVVITRPSRRPSIVNPQVVVPTCTTHSGGRCVERPSVPMIEEFEGNEIVATPPNESEPIERPLEDIDGGEIKIRPPFEGQVVRRPSDQQIEGGDIKVRPPFGGEHIERPVAEDEGGQMKIRPPLQHEYITYPRRTTPSPRFPAVSLITRKPMRPGEDVNEVALIDTGGDSTVYITPKPERITVEEDEGENPEAHHIIRRPAPGHEGGIDSGEVERGANGKDLWSPQREDELCIMLKRMFAAQLRSQRPHGGGMISFNQMYRHYLKAQREPDSSYNYTYEGYPGGYSQINSYEVERRPSSIQQIRETVKHARPTISYAIDSSNAYRIQAPSTYYKWQKKPAVYETKWTTNSATKDFGIYRKNGGAVKEVIVPESQWKNTIKNNQQMVVQQIVKGGQKNSGTGYAIVKESVRGPVYQTSWSTGPVKSSYKTSWTKSTGPIVNDDSYETTVKREPIKGGGYKTSWKSLPKQPMYQQSWKAGPYPVFTPQSQRTYQKSLPSEEVLIESRLAKEENGTAAAEKADPSDISSEDVTLNGPGCGQSLILRGRIVNGEPAPEGRFPWLIHLKIVRGSPFVCAASLITPRFLLTAAHCILQRGELPTSIEAGYGNTNKKHAHYVAVSSFKLHPLYSRVPFEKHDIALLMLSRRLEPRLARPICISDESETGRDGRFADMEKELATVAGWGVDKATGGKSSTILKFAKLDILPSVDCVRSPKLAKVAFERSSQMCTLGNGTDTCFQGDSGGPVMVPRRTNEGSPAPGTPMEQRGVVSFGFSCASPTPAVATRLDFYIAWIKSSFLGWNSDPEVRQLEAPALHKKSPVSEVSESVRHHQALGAAGAR